MKPKLPFGMENLKKLKKEHLLMIVLAGILLLVIAIPVEDTKKKTGETSEKQEKIQTVQETEDDSAYVSSLEGQLEKILGAMEGVGNVKVMITLKDDGESVVEKDVTRTEETVTEEGGEGTKRENKVINSAEETIYIQGETTDSAPFVAKEVKPRVEGVLVVAQGGQNAVVVKNISDAVLALFPIEAHKIKVVKMN